MINQTMDRKIEENEISELTKLMIGRPYRPINKISYGSYGEIFKIIGIEDGKQYALKVISKQKMIKEQKLHETIIQGIVLQKLRHPGIVKYIESMESQLYISHVIELCPYGDMSDAFKKIDANLQMAFKRKQILQYYLAQIVQALNFLHDQQIIHRDLKLQNILVGPDLNCRVIDFGTAKILDTQRTFTKSQIQFIENIRKQYKSPGEDLPSRTKSFVGSANYLAPQSIGLEYTFKSDIWSLGILAYKLFHGKLPFTGQNNFEIFTSIKQHKQQQTLEINKSLDKDTHDFLISCLKINPEDRPSIKQLKKHPYFADINFQTIFFTKPPVDAKAFKAQKMPNVQRNLQKLDFNMKVQKKMFMGNYKPRILKMYNDASGKKLLMSYWYVDNTTLKNEFQMSMGDYAYKISKIQFVVTNGDVKYTFKVKEAYETDEVVEKINFIIKQHYE